MPKQPSLLDIKVYPSFHCEVSYYVPRISASIANKTRLSIINTFFFADPLRTCLPCIQRSGKLLSSSPISLFALLYVGRPMTDGAAIHRSKNWTAPADLWPTWAGSNLATMRQSDPILSMTTRQSGQAPRAPKPCDPMPCTRTRCAASTRTCWEMATATRWGRTLSTRRLCDLAPTTRTGVDQTLFIKRRSGPSRATRRWCGPTRATRIRLLDPTPASRQHQISTKISTRISRPLCRWLNRNPSFDRSWKLLKGRGKWIFMRICKDHKVLLYVTLALNYFFPYALTCREDIIHNIFLNKKCPKCIQVRTQFFFSFCRNLRIDRDIYLKLIFWAVILFHPDPIEAFDKFHLSGKSSKKTLNKKWL